MMLREFISLLDRKGILLKIKKEVDAELETATVMKMLDGKPLLFENVRGYKMPVAANVCSTRELIAMGIGTGRKQLLHKMIASLETPKEPETVAANGYSEIDVDLERLPILKYYPFDGGKYIASGIVVAKDAEYGINASYHRAMVLGRDRMVLRILERHFDAYLKRGLKEFAFCIGNPVSVMIAGAISTGIGMSELAIANALTPTPVTSLGGHTVPQSEIVMICEMTGELHDEGPFLDLTETVDIVRKQKVCRVKKIFARKDAVFHALLPGGLEHKHLMGMPREPTIYSEVAKVCEVKDVLITPGGCSWLHGAVSIRKKGADDGIRALQAGFRGHKSMKHLFVVDDDIDIHNPHDIEWAMATRFQGDRGIVMMREKGSSLDPSSDMETGMTMKVGFDLTIPASGGAKNFRRPELPVKLNIDDYIPKECR
jgi:UbiD family decarboxylase